VKSLHLGVVIDVDGGTLEIEEAQTGICYMTQYHLGRSMASDGRSTPRLATTHGQRDGCFLKRPDVGDAVCFEISEESQAVSRWGYVNRFLLMTEKLYPSRFVPRLVKQAR
jgi:hypothetical protein